jgi:hypothetical protein
LVGVEVEVTCPSCGEPLAVWIDVGGGTAQRYVEDCQVCCKPMEVTARLDAEGDADVSVRTLDD